MRSTSRARPSGANPSWGTFPRRRCGTPFYFFQAEDGIRYLTVTGVQTCALPICWMGRAHQMPEEKVDELIATNLKGVLNTTQSALPWMLERRRGVIINVASVVGFRSSPYSAVYSATKHGVVGFSHALRGELSGTGVKVCVVYPGVTSGTEFFKDPDRAVGPQYPAWWVANLIVRTARYPRRDVMVFPLRLAQLAEPVFGGLMDHAIGEIRRRTVPD